MEARKQYQQFLTWLKRKQAELVEEYWLQSEEGQKGYRRLLLRIQAEIEETERLLGI